MIGYYRIMPMKHITPVDFMDDLFLHTGATAIPKSSDPPLQIVAALGAGVTHVMCVDGVGKFIGLYKGPVGSEELAAIIAGGYVYMVPVNIKPGTRLSVRSLEDDPISIADRCISITFFA